MPGFQKITAERISAGSPSGVADHLVLAHSGNIDAVEEALCFGWIDSTVRTMDNSAMQRLAPRRKGNIPGLS